MALDFVEQFPVARAVFDEASAALGVDVAAICAGDPRLGLTEFTQPCILTAEIAMMAALRERFAFAPERYGGHSLGEYTALVAAGALPLAAAVRLVRLRGRLMQDAVPVGQGGMAAIVQTGLDLDAVARIAAECDIDVANFNSLSQVVLSGSAAGLARATALVEERLRARVIALDVSAPFHSRLLAGIEPEFARALDEVRPSLDARRATAVTSNFRGGFHTGEVDALIEALTRQISGSVRWIDNMRALADGPSPKVFEVGPNRPLTRFWKELGHEATAILNVRGAEKAFA
jgi:[acyl-carrier-protein] S-malonyltransferase/trans-AT polyketide synthase/acyltransferase/oxidoreductase domain-containing protein